ncbi:hypothetical protein RHO13_03335 [Orbus wheelerorum]|uniref:hypothetical protein n=1 Tax=Orbus wheelerorum TaxID=3074111 RepID=UPI00370D0642
MKKYINILFSSLLILFLQLKTPFAIVKNPFLLPPTLSCDELKDQLMSKLSLWQYQGYIGLFSTKQHIDPIIGLSNQGEWLIINEVVAPISLMPWLIIDISPKYITWQADLPHYCKKRITYNMIFVGGNSDAINHRR